MNLFLAFLLAGAVGASAQLPAANLTRIGAAAAVKGLVNAMAPGTTVGRVVESGKPLYLNDHVTTDAAGRLQVLLLDETVFTVGPNSDMVLDEFVYDPTTSSGKVTARVTKGVFRFVTGKVARKDPASMKVNLPVGTIGIRGTIAAGQVTDQNATVILLGPGSQNNANENPGAVSVSNSGGQVDLTQPGFGTTLAQGLPPTPPTNMSQQLSQILGSLGGPAPSGSQSSDGGASGTQASGQGGTSVTQASGQGTAAGGALANTSADMISFSNSANTTVTGGAQLDNAIALGNGIAEGFSTWEQVLSISQGQAYYYSSAGITCSGCVSTLPLGALQLQIDFNSRTIGGPNGPINPANGSMGSFIQLNGVTSTVDTLQQTIGLIHFDSLTGDASLVLKTSPSAPNEMALGGLTLNGESASPLVSGSFDGTTIKLRNSGGVAAAAALTNLQFSGTNSVTTPVPLTVTDQPFTAPISNPAGIGLYSVKAAASSTSPR